MKGEQDRVAERGIKNGKRGKKEFTRGALEVLKVEKDCIKEGNRFGMDYTKHDRTDR